MDEDTRRGIGRALHRAFPMPDDSDPVADETMDKLARPRFRKVRKDERP